MELDDYDKKNNDPNDIKIMKYERYCCEFLARAKGRGSFLRYR
jgi:hypothetical protein